MTEIVVGWKTLLTMDSPDWHDGVSTVIAEASADGVLIREADLTEYTDPTSSIDLLLISYLASQHSRVREDKHLSAVLNEVKCGVRTLILFGIDRTSNKDRVRSEDTRSILDDQAWQFGQERFGYRTLQSDELSARFRSHIESRARVSLRAVNNDASIDPAISTIQTEPDWRNYV